MKWHTRPATEADLVAIAPRLRQADINECAAVCDLAPLDALRLGLPNSSAVVVDTLDYPIAIFGVQPMPLPKMGAVWMTSTEDIAQPPYVGQFIRHSRTVLNTLHAQYPLLCNVVDARNTVHIRWLKWCGFIFLTKHERYGPQQRPFWEFARITPCVYQPSR